MRTGKGKRFCDYGMINQILSRDCHVGESYLTAARYVWEKLTPNGKKQLRSLSRWDKRQFQRIVRYYHATHRQTYGIVTTACLNAPEWMYSALRISAIY